MQVERELSGATVQEQAPLRAAVRAARHGVPVPGLEARAWPGGPLLSLARSRDATITAEIRFARRGRHELAPASVVIGDPLGLAGRTILSSADDVLVLPRIEPLQLTDLGGRADELGAAKRACGRGRRHRGRLARCPPTRRARVAHPLADGGADDHVDGAALWPTVTRRRLWSWTRVTPPAPDALDQALRAAASLCVHLARDGACGLLLPGDRRPARFDRELHGFAESHARLALLEPDAGAPPLGCLAGATTVVLGDGRDGRAAAVAQLRAPARYLVSPHPRPGWPVRFTVAGCSGQWLEERGEGGVTAAHRGASAAPCVWRRSPA